MLFRCLLRTKFCLIFITSYPNWKFVQIIGEPNQWEFSLKLMLTQPYDIGPTLFNRYWMMKSQISKIIWSSWMIFGEAKLLVFFCNCVALYFLSSPFVFLWTKNKKERAQRSFFYQHRSARVGYQWYWISQ